MRAQVYRGNQLVIEAFVEIIPDVGHVFPREGSNASVKMINFLARENQNFCLNDAPTLKEKEN